MRKLSCIAIALLAAGCATHEAKTEVPVTDHSAATGNTAATASTSSTSSMAKPTIAGNPLDDPNNILAKRSIYFDFDSNLVKDQFEPIVKAHAYYMASHAESRARIEGNCDERGSREYNLALGQRRAEAVAKQMEALGVSTSHIETVSYGEEKPVAKGHDEADWAKNRRDDIRYTIE